MLHCSPRNESDTERPLLLNTLTSADAFPYTVNPIRPKHDQTIIRGKRAAWAHHDPPVPAAAGLVRRIHVDLRAPAGGGAGNGGDRDVTAWRAEREAPRGSVQDSRGVTGMLQRGSIRALAP